MLFPSDPWWQRLLARARAVAGAGARARARVCNRIVVGPFRISWCCFCGNFMSRARAKVFNRIVVSHFRIC